MYLDDITGHDRFVRDFNSCAERYRARFLGHPAYRSGVFVPCEHTLRGDQPALVETLMSWMCADQWHALERMGAEIHLMRDMRTRGTQVEVYVRHVDAEAVFANNSFVVARILQTRTEFHNVAPGSLYTLGEVSGADRAGEIRRPSLLFEEGRDLGTATPLPVQPSVHVQGPAIPASSERRLALNHKLRGKKDVTYSETLSPRRVRKPKHRT